MRRWTSSVFFAHCYILYVSTEELALKGMSMKQGQICNATTVPVEKSEKLCRNWVLLLLLYRVYITLSTETIQIIFTNRIVHQSPCSAVLLVHATTTSYCSIIL